MMFLYPFIHLQNQKDQKLVSHKGKDRHQPSQYNPAFLPLVCVSQFKAKSGGQGFLLDIF